MSTLVRALLVLRRAVRRAAALCCALALGAVVVVDAASPLPLPYAALAALALGALFMRGIRVRLRSIEAPARVDVELGVTLVVASMAVAERADLGLDGRMFPLVYACVALTSAFAAPLVAAIVAAWAVGLEVAIRVFGPGELPVGKVLIHAAFIAAFTTMNATVLRTEIARLRRTARARLAAEITRLRDDARTYRLLGAPAQDRAMRRGDDERLARSGVEEIHQSVLLALRLLRESLALHTAMLVWTTDAGAHLRISEVASESTELSEGPFLMTEGIFGAVLSQRAPVSIAGLKPAYRLPYYTAPCPVRVVHARPVFEHGALRGVLVVDRVDERPLSPREQELVEEAGRYAVRTIQNERVFVQLERAKAEQGKLYRAAEALGAATTEAEVVDAGVTSAREITAVDFAAITLYEEATRSHEIRAVSGDGAGALVGQRFRHNTGLVAMVLENRHPLPYRGEYDEHRQVVFTRRLVPPAMPSLVVLPLSVHDRPLGTLVLASRRRGAFGDATRPTLEVLASHMAVSLSNARMLHRLEELATIDGLTGLLNKRAMTEVAEQKMIAARRFGRSFSLLVVDIDHFKRVNDTYGHDAGDVVIKGLGSILRHAKRTTDAVGRFGGEEFVVACEETDARGAMLLAERVRDELFRTTFHHDRGPITVTCSVGVATYPEAGETWDELFRAADEALYGSKRAGRNRSTAWQPLAAHTRRTVA